MNYLFIDFECTYTKTITLKKMTLRRYLDASSVLGFSASENGECPTWFSVGDDMWEPALDRLREIALSPDWTVVAHNAAFDMRVWHHKLGLPYPKHMLCSMELAFAAYPNHPGGYSLANLATTLNLGGTKLEIDLNPGKFTESELEAYCIRDTELCINLFRKCHPRLSPSEIRIAELCMTARELYFHVDQTRVMESVQQLSDAATAHASLACDVLGDEVFGWDGEGDGKIVRSVKPADVKRALLEAYGFDTPTISFKKLDAESLRASPDAASALKAIERTNKTLSNRRRVGAFVSSTVIDAELGYYRAHTGRFSSPQVGGSKGINLHNLPKRDKTLAKAIRTLFSLPDHLCFVRADLSNVEYRIESWLTHSHHPTTLFEQAVMSDPYAAFWYSATGQKCSKHENVAARQLAKAAVLGLGYGMGLKRWIEELCRGLSDPTFKVTLADLDAICKSNGWTLPKRDNYINRIRRETRAPETVICVAFHTRRLFHQLHPEFFQLAGRIDSGMAEALRSLDPGDIIAAMSTDRLEFIYDDTRYGPGVKSVRARCGLWDMPTVTWRDLCFRETRDGGYSLHCMHSTKGYRTLTKNIILENLTQSAARNALCKGQLQLQDMGYTHQLSVHDEELLVVPRNEDAVRAARQALLDVYGPGNALGYDWAICIDPAEINVSRTLYETETDWDHLDLYNLP